MAAMDGAVVSVARCATYDRAEVADAVARAVELAGGMGRFVTKGARALVKPNLAGPLPRAEHLTRLQRQCQSNLEKKWLQFLEERDLRLPSSAQKFIDDCTTRPDFLYDDCQAAIYVDGPHHDYPDRKERDTAQTDSMEDLGYSVIRFAHHDDWEDIIRQHPNIFGRI